VKKNLTRKKVLYSNQEQQVEIQATIVDLTLTEEAKDRTVNDLRKTDESHKLIIQQQREKLTLLKELSLP
jgi:hypothetical protein